LGGGASFETVTLQKAAGRIVTNSLHHYITIKLLKQETSWMKDKLLKCGALWDHAPVAQLDRY